MPKSCLYCLAVDRKTTKLNSGTYQKIYLKQAILCVMDIRSFWFFHKKKSVAFKSNKIQ